MKNLKEHIKRVPCVCGTRFPFFVCQTLIDMKLALDAKNLTLNFILFLRINLSVNRFHSLEVCRKLTTSFGSGAALGLGLDWLGNKPKKQNGG